MDLSLAVEKITTRPPGLKKRRIYLLLLLFSGLMLVKLLPALYVRIDTPVYLTIHTSLEFLSIVVSLAVFIVAWYNYQQTTDFRELVICLTFFAVGLIDFAHTLSYNGMPVFLTGNSVNKASAYWIIARLIEGCGLLTAVIVPDRPASRFFRPVPLLLLTSVVTSFVLIAVAYDHDKGPLMFIPGIGQTPLKIGLEYVVIGLKAVSFGLLFRERDDQATAYYLQAAFIFGIFAEIAFTLYSSAYDTYNLIGHIYKIGAFAFILRGLFVSSIVRLYETNRILSEQKRLLAEVNTRLAEADRLKNEFLANTNHELRTPLTAILAFAELLLDKDTGPLNETQRDYVNEIYDSGQQLLNDINNLLDLSKIEAGKMELQLEPVNVHATAERVARKFAPLLKQKDQQLKCNISDIPTVWIDDQKIKKILYNLVSNAHKFTPDGGKINLEINYHPNQKELHFVIEDNGAGIRPEDTAVIFEKFRRVHKSAHGTGLGLTLVKHLVELHRGRIWVESGPGRGSRFYFTVKAEMDPEVG